LGLADDVEGMPNCMNEWIEAALERYSQDEGVKLLKAKSRKET
jgi:hypothetical protein